MAIEIKEKFRTHAAIDVVWQFVVDPHRVVTCLPGAQLVEQLNDKTYVGAVKVKLGAITTAYKGEVVFASVDEANHVMKLSGEGKEKGGGTAKGTVEIELTGLADGQTEMAIVARVDLTGKVMQIGGPMIKGVSKQLFKQFAASAKKQLEALPAVSADEATSQAAAPTGSRSEGPSASQSTSTPTSPPAAQTESEPDVALAVVPLLAKTLWAAVLNFLRRLFGRAER